MKMIVIILLAITFTACDLSAGNKSSSNTDDHSVVNEASECPLCSSDEGLDSLGYDVEILNCDSECEDFCDNLNAAGDPTEELDTCKDCKAGCESNNEGNLELVIDRCRQTYLCTDISDEN